MTWRPAYIAAPAPWMSNTKNVEVPADIERRWSHEPCTYCGVRPDVPCKHKAIAA